MGIVKSINYQWAILIRDRLKRNVRLEKCSDAKESWDSFSRSRVSVTITISIFACRPPPQMGGGPTHGTMVSRRRRKRRYSNVDQLVSMTWAKGGSMWEMCGRSHGWPTNSFKTFVCCFSVI